MTKTDIISSRQKALIKMSCLSAFVLWVCSAYSGVPLVSDLTIAAGPRGVAVSISADAPFDAHLVKSAGSSVYISLKGCTYGLNAFKYDQFAPDAAVKSVHAQEIKKGTEIQLVITLRASADSIIRTHSKGKSWLALISSKQFSEFRWSSSDYALKYIESDHDSVRVTTANTLRCIRLLNRENVCELFFDFTTVVGSDISRSDDTLIIKFNNAQSAIDSTSFRLPEGTVFKSVILKEMKSDQNPELTAFVILDLNNADSSLNIACKKGRGLSLFTMLKNGQKAVLWNSLKGLELGYDFYQMPVYEVDMKSLEKRALKDTEMVIPEDLLFAIQEKLTVPQLDTFSRPLEKIASDTIKPEQVPQKYQDPANEISPSGIQTVRQVVSDSALALNISLESEVPVPLTGEFLGDTGFNGNSKNLIRYYRNGRDPFTPFNGYMESNLGLPFLENLHLVGILFDEGDRIALLEDKKSQNRPFTMREEDRVEKGKVLKIYRDKVVFLITEYGISRSVILRLTNTSPNQEVGTE